MPVELRRSVEITVGLPPERAMPLFTAEGERRWADGWAPRYPEPTRREGPGAVFTTGHGDHETIWVMVDHGAERIRYARVMPGMTAGTVSVDVVASDAHASRVRISYDLTALSAAGEKWLASLTQGFEAEIASWATAIAAALKRAPIQRS